MAIRFQADADLDQTIVRNLLRQEPGVDFLSAADAGLRGLPDPEVLKIAADAGRVLVSHDGRTMPVHFGEFLRGATSPGLIIVPQHLPVSLAADELLMIWSASEAAEWIDRMVWMLL